MKLEFHHTDETPYGGVTVTVGGQAVLVNSIEVKMDGTDGTTIEVRLPVNEISGFISFPCKGSELLKCCAVCNGELREADGIGQSDGKSN